MPSHNAGSLIRPSSIVNNTGTSNSDEDTGNSILTAAPLTRREDSDDISDLAVSMAGLRSSSESSASDIDTTLQAWQECTVILVEWTAGLEGQ